MNLLVLFENYKVFIIVVNKTRLHKHYGKPIRRD